MTDKAPKNHGDRVSVQNSDKVAADRSVPHEKIPKALTSTENRPGSIAVTPEPPYYAVIFTSLQSDALDGYAETAEAMLALAAEQDGFLGIESARSGLGITVSYWRDLQSIEQWKAHVDHRAAKQQGISQWYRHCCTRIAYVESCYSRLATSS